jgi:hypothetical protein
MIALLCCTAGSLAVAPVAPAADPFYGLFAPNMSHPPAQLAAEFNAQATAGVGTLREHLHWDRIERAPGIFDFTDSDALITAAAQRGMTVLPVLIDTPSFYSTRPAGVTTGGWPPRDPASIKRFATELARRYGTRGTYWGCLLPGLLCRRPYTPIRAWQVWNEPDIPSWWQTGVDARAYTALLRQGYEGLKAGDGSAEVVLAGLTTRVVAPGAFLDQLYDGGAAAYFDSLAIHPYAVNVGGVVNYVRSARAIAAAHGDGAVPIRVTEYGFATGGVREWVTTPICQAALVAATTRELSARRAELNLRSIVQFQWQDRSTDPAATWPNHAGLLYLDGSAKPALGAFTDAVAGRPPAAGLSVPEACPSQHQG